MVPGSAERDRTGGVRGALGDGCDGVGRGVGLNEVYVDARNGLPALIADPNGNITLVAASLAAH